MFVALSYVRPLLFRSRVLSDVLPKGYRTSFHADPFNCSGYARPRYSQVFSTDPHNLQKSLLQYYSPKWHVLSYSSNRPRSITGGPVLGTVSVTHLRPGIAPSTTLLTSAQSLRPQRYALAPPIQTRFPPVTRTIPHQHLRFPSSMSALNQCTSCAAQRSLG